MLIKNDIVKKLMSVVLSIAMIVPSLLTPLPAYAASTVEVRSFSASVQDGAKKVGDDWVWEANTAEADHRYTFRVNYSIAGTFEHQPGDVRIVIPKQLLKDRSGEYADYYDMSLPEAGDPEIDDSTEFVYEEDGDNLVITNIKELPTAQNGFFEVSYLTSKQTLNYLDYGADGAGSDDFVAEITVTHEGDSDTATSDPLKVYMDTTAEIMDTDKRIPKLHKQWDPAWGDDVKPDNAEDYYYLVWEVRTRIEPPTQPYNFSLEDIFDTSTDGEVVGYKMQGEKTYRADSLVENINKVTYKDYDERYDYVLTRHDKNIFTDAETLEFKNYVQGCVDPIDQVDEDTYAQSNKQWLYKKPKFVEPNGHFMLWKWGLDYRDIRVYDSEDIRNFTLTEFQAQRNDSIDDLRYHVEQIGYPYPWTLDGDPTDPSNYGKKPVKYVITDRDFTINDNERQLTKDDYELAKLNFTYAIRDAEFDVETQTFISKPAAFTDDDVIDFYAEFNGDGNYVKVGTYNLKTNTFSQTGNHLESVNGKTLYFKENCTGWKAETENAYYMTDIHFYPSINLKDSEFIKSETDGKDQVWVNNKAESSVYNNAGNKIVDFAKFGTDYIIGTHKDGHIKKKSTGFKSNKAKRLCYIDWEVNVNEDFMDPTAVRRNTVQTSGVFYDLVPIGGEVVEDSIEVLGLNDKKTAKAAFTYRIKRNYKGSGRDLLIVTVTDPAEVYTLKYKTSHSWDAIKDHGLDVTNNVAYETGNESIGDGSGDTGGGVDEFADLDPEVDDEEKFLYSRYTHRIAIITAANLGLYKKIKSAQDDNYVYKTTTYPDSDYSYYIRFATDDETTAKNLIVFDSLENYVVKKAGEPDKTSAWHGKLQSVDTTVAEQLGAKPVVYYSTVENLDLEAHHDLTDTNVWSTSIDNIEDAKAIAIDIRKKEDNSDFVLDYDTSMSFVLNMKSPQTGSGNGDDIAYNNIYLNDTVISKEGFEADFFIHQDYTQIKFRVVGDVEFDKVAAADHSEKIQGIKFRLFGTSDYDNDINMEAVSDQNGHVKFSKVEKGTYELQELGGHEDWLVDHETKTVTIDDTGTTTISLPQESDVYVFENEPRIHTDIEFRKKSILGGDEPTEPYEPDLTAMRYAVQILGIGTDTDDKGKTLGLTFGPATGTEYVSKYKSHEATGKTSKGNDHRCIHNDDWKTILFWNHKDPNVYEQCISEGCTHSIELNIPDAIKTTDTYIVRYKGDGPGVLSSELIGNAKKWNAYLSSSGNYNNEYDNTGGWGASNIRAVLNGVDDDNSDGIETNDNVWARNNNINTSKALISAFPQELQDAIAKRATKYDSVYSAIKPANLKTTYDKLWLLSSNEIWNIKKNGFPEYYEHPLEGTQYPRYAASVGDSSPTATEQTALRGCAADSNAIGGTSVGRWTRSITNDSRSAIIVDSSSKVRGYDLSFEYGLSPCFSLDRSVYEPVDRSKNMNISGVTFKLEGTSDYGTDVLEYYTSSLTGLVKFKDLEKGTYRLTETETNEEFILNQTEYEVKVDENGNISISNPKDKNDEFVQEKEGDWYLYNEPYHEFSLRKRDAVNPTQWLGGAEFSLTGVSDYGTRVDRTVTSTDLGRVTFDWLESGTYVLKETKAPDNHKLDATERIVTIDKQGNVTIDGLSQEAVTGFFVVDNERSSDGHITITKKWNDGLTGEAADNRPEPTIHISTKEPEHFNGYTVTYDANGGNFSNGKKTNVVRVLSSEDPQGNITNTVTEGTIKTPSGYFNGNTYMTFKGWYTDPECTTPFDLDSAWIGEDTTVYAGYENKGGAYAVLDDEGTLTLFRSAENYSNNTTGTFTDVEGNTYTGRIFSGIELQTSGNPIWQYKKSSIKTVKIAEDQTINPKTCSSWFGGCINMTSCHLEGLDTSNVTDMKQMFFNCKALTSLDVSGLDTSNVTDMSAMFSRCQALTSLDLSGWDTPNVTDVSSMFEYCTALTSLDATDFDTSHVTNMHEMFYRCQALTSLDLSSWDTPNVTDMSNMFKECTALTSLDVSGFDTSNVTNMREMFDSCSKLTSLDLSSWDTSNTTNMYLMFYQCSVITNIYVSDLWDTSNVSESSSMFSACRRLPNFKINVIDKTNAHYNAGGYLTYKAAPVHTSDTNDMHTADMKGGFSFKSLLVETGVIMEAYAATGSREGTAYAVLTDANDVTGEGNLIFFRSNDAYTNKTAGTYTDINGTTYSGTVFTGVETMTNVQYPGWYSSFRRVKTVSIAEGQIVAPISCSRWFYSFENMTSCNLDGLDTSNVTSMYEMFYFCENLTSLDVSNFDTSNVTDTSYMFCGCKKLPSLDVSNLNTSKVTDMSGMFATCSALPSLDVSNLDTSKVTKMNGMFANCTNLASLDLSTFDTSKVTDMHRMFEESNKMTSLDLSTFDTSKVTNMEGMFENCTALTNVILSGWDTSNVGNMGYMFSNCNALTSLDITSFDTSKVTNMENMFAKCNALASLDLSGFDTSKVTKMKSMFASCSALTNLDVSGWDTSSVTDMSYMFENCSSLTNPDVSDFDTLNITTMKRMFFGCKGLPTIDLSAFDTSKVIDMSYMFSSCYALTNLDLSTLDTSKVADMKYMFSNCNSLTNLNISGWDTSNVRDMESMFEKCSALTSLDLSSIIIPKVRYLRGMLFNCSSLTSLDISNFDTTNGVDMSRMFIGCNKLDLVAVGPKTFFRNSSGAYPSGSNWSRYSLLSGMKTHDDVQYDTLRSYDGSNPGWYRLGDAIPHNEDELYDGYISKQLTHADVEWVHVDDDTWTYTFNVYDEDAKYYVWEDLLQGFSTDTDQNHPQTINDIPGWNEKTATITNTFRDQEPPEPPTPPEPPVDLSGKLKVTKTVTAGEGTELTDEDLAKEFAITITLSGHDGTEVINGTVFKDGVGTVFLKSGDSFVIEGLDAGTEYTVEEAEIQGYEASYEDSASGTIASQTTSAVAVTNTKQVVPETPKNGFTLKKKLKGGYALGGDEFGFRIAFSGLTANTPYTVADGITFTSNARGEGNVTLTMRGGDTKVFSGLPVGSSYQITELENPYFASYKISDSNGGDFRLIEKNKDKNTENDMALSTAKENVDENEVITVTFTNERSLPSPTGIPAADRTLFTMIAVLSAALVFILHQIRKKKTGSAA